MKISACVYSIVYERAVCKSSMIQNHGKNSQASLTF